MEILVVVVLGVWGALALARRRRREEELAAQVGRLASQLAHLEQEHRGLADRVGAMARGAAAPGPAVDTAAPPPSEPAPPVAPAVAPAPSAEPAAAAPGPLPTTVVSAPAVPPPPAIPPPPEVPSAPEVPPAPSNAPVHAPVPVPGFSTRPPAPERPPAPRAPPRPSPLRSLDWERLVGVKLYSWLAGVAVVVAALSFVRYSVDHGWVTAPVRMAMGLAVGLALLLGGETRRAQAYRVTAQALAAGGVATLFATFYAAHALWHLVPALPTFGLLALVAAVAVLVSIRRDALVVALLGLLGGFATPFLLSTGENRPFGLFSYLLLLNVGLSWVAHRKRWPLLSALSLLFTGVYQAGWVARFLDGTQLPIAVGVFLVFPLVGFAGLALARRGASAEAPPLARWTAAAGAVPPALFALYLAATGDYSAHAPLVLGFLAVVAAGLAAIAAWQGPEWLHLLGGGAALATVAAFLARSFRAGAWPALAGFLAVLVAVYLGAPLLLARLGRDFRAEGRLGALVAPLLLAAFPVAAVRLPSASPWTFLGLLLVLAAACSAFALLRADGRVHLAAAGAALAAEAAWSAFHLGPDTLLGALLAYGAFAALFLAVPLLAARRGRPLAAAGAGPLLLASMGLLLFLAAGPVAQASLGGLAVLAVLLEAALLWEAAHGRSLALALAGVVLGFVVLAVWWVTALAVAVLVPALLAAGALALVALGGTLLAARGASTDGERQATALAPFLGLAGHLFLAAVAAQRALALPPWPWLGVLLALDLGYLAAALVRRRGELLAGAAAASVAVLLAFEAGLGGEAPAPALAGRAALGVAALGVGGFLAARRRGAAPAGPGAFAVAAAVALLGAQGVLLVGAAGDGLPLAFLVLAHGVLVAALLAVAALAPAEALALAAALSGAAPAAALRWLGGGGPGDALWLATPLWLLPLAYPLLRGRRGRAERLPFLAAVVASAAYFFTARSALVELGAGPFLGALPVAQALLLVPHLVLLVRLEPPSERDRGRLALVAAAVLAFVTVAIPLQLERQWITLGWAFEAAALAWLWRRLPHRGLLAWSAALFAAAFARLTLNPAVLAYAPKSALPIWNWWLYAYTLAAAAFLAGAAVLARAPGEADRLAPGTPRLSRLLGAGGGVLLFVLLNVEIADFWSEGEHLAFRLTGGGLAQDLSYTIGWAVFAIAVLVAGVALASRATRAAAIGLLAVTVAKAFLHDLARLEGLYRVASFVGLAACLAAVAVVLQRYVLRPDGRDHPEVP